MEEKDLKSQLVSIPSNRGISSDPREGCNVMASTDVSIPSNRGISSDKQDTQDIQLTIGSQSPRIGAFLRTNYSEDESDNIESLNPLESGHFFGPTHAVGPWRMYASLNPLESGHFFGLEKE